METIELSNHIQSETSFCIIIPARNEEKNILPLLESIQKSIQNANAEIIVIDDHSTDSTLQICKEYFEKNPIGKVLALHDFLDKSEPQNSYKKKAIQLAVHHTNADWIIQTDADCIVSEKWMQCIRQIVAIIETEYFTGPVRLISKRNDSSAFLFHAFQALDFMTMQGITMAGYYRSQGQMSNGANMGYSKKLFNRVNGFQNIDTIASGDDMLLLDKIKSQTNARTSFLKNKEAIVDTEIVYTLKDFIHQRIRWGSKSKYYKDISLKYQLGLVYVVNVLIFCMMFFGFFEMALWKWAFFFIIIKTIVELILVVPLANFFRQKQFIPLFPILQPFHIIYVVSVGLLSFFGTYQWKDRTVR